ncbi:hypothetical protein AAU61_03990 [Desulfocarbo indianensis]|nr:hypothetical protein AAU61_03990 [Desulfocarbo indianensis]
MNVFHNVEALQQAARDLSDARRVLEAICRSAPMGIGLWRERRLMWANQACYRMLGRSEEDLAGCDARVLYADLEEYERAGRLLYLPGGPAEADVRFRRGDGREIVARIRAAALDEHDLSQGHVVTMVDLSREEEAERELQDLKSRLRQSQKMEALGVLAGGIAHDFNNILGAIMGYTQLTMEDLPAGSQERDNLDQALKAGERARDLVKHILAFSRRAGQEKRPVSLTPLIKETLHLLRPALPPKVELRQKLGPENGPVLADSTQFHQVLMNLCTNAVQAMQSQGGVLEVGLEDVELDQAQAKRLGGVVGLRPGPYRKLTVRDSGQGMEPEVAARIFEPFFTTKGIDQGTGLGLAVAHGVVRSHGGAISVESAPGQGSVFYVWLPRGLGAPQSVQTHQGPLPGGSERVLFVDDEASLVEVARRMMERLGYRVETFSAGDQALEAFAADPHGFDLVITDLSMPQMSGLHFARKIRQMRAEIPVLLCTGFSQALQGNTPEELGLKGILMKPLLWRDLALAIRRALDDSQG